MLISHKSQCAKHPVHHRELLQEHPFFPFQGGHLGSRSICCSLGRYGWCVPKLRSSKGHKSFRRKHKIYNMTWEFHP